MPMNIALQDINWDSQLQDLDLAQSWSYFAETLIELIEKYIPVSKVRGDGGKNNPYITRNSQRN